jgi:hypothetical protein
VPKRIVRRHSTPPPRCPRRRRRAWRQRPQRQMSSSGAARPRSTRRRMRASCGPWRTTTPQCTLADPRRSRLQGRGAPHASRTPVYTRGARARLLTRAPCASTRTLRSLAHACAVRLHAHLALACSRVCRAPPRAPCARLLTRAPCASTRTSHSLRPRPRPPPARPGPREAEEGARAHAQPLADVHAVLEDASMLSPAAAGGAVLCPCCIDKK